jgi:soluble lytic murein transglycosylase-like protein
MSYLTLLFLSVTQTFNLPGGLIRAICYTESHFAVEAVHVDDGGGNSVGVCQIKLRTARSLGFRGTEKQLRIPKNNVYFSAKYLYLQLHRYHSNVHKAVAAYNAGRYRDQNGRAKNYHYVKKVFKAWKEHK